MLSARPLDSSGLEEAYYRLYREFFSRAEKRRRWSVDDDIPWDQVNPRLNPAIADVVESLCAVELYLPDYIAKAIPMFRATRGRVWFHANWGYEESKHSLALGDWLVRAGMRTEEQLADLEATVFSHDWNLPHDSPLGMVLYGMVQELATWLSYRNLSHRSDEGGDPALTKVLRLVCVDERAHHDFYKRVTSLYLERDRAGTIEELRRVIAVFQMPAIHMLADCRQRVASIRALQIFDEDQFYRDVVRPILDTLGITWAEFRQRNPVRKSS
jgi:acyl-[acyl-carrier-protein] desaturase